MYSNCTSRHDRSRHGVEIRLIAGLAPRRGCTAAARRPAGPRLRRSDRTDWASPRRAPGARSTTHWAMANSASRVPLTGSTWRAGSTAPSGRPCRRTSQAAIAARSVVRAGRLRIPAEAVQILDQRVAHQRRRRVARLADGQIDQRQAAVVPHVGQQTAQALERVRLQVGETGVHGGTRAALRRAWPVRRPGGAPAARAGDPGAPRR